MSLPHRSFLRALSSSGMHLLLSCSHPLTALWLTRTPVCNPSAARPVPLPLPSHARLSVLCLVARWSIVDRSFLPPTCDCGRYPSVSCSSNNSIIIANCLYDACVMLNDLYPSLSSGLVLPFHPITCATSSSPSGAISVLHTVLVKSLSSAHASSLSMYASTASSLACNQPSSRHSYFLEEVRMSESSHQYISQLVDWLEWSGSQQLDSRPQSLNGNQNGSTDRDTLYQYLSTRRSRRATMQHAPRHEGSRGVAALYCPNYS